MNKTIFTLSIIVAFVAGSIMTATMADAKKPSTNDPFAIIWNTINALTERVSQNESDISNHETRITDNEIDIESLDARVSSLEGDSFTYVITRHIITNCDIPGCDSDGAVICDNNDVAIAGSSVGVYETKSGQTYTVSQSSQSTFNTTHDSWLWTFAYSGAPVGWREGITLSATCLITPP